MPPEKRTHSLRTFRTLSNFFCGGGGLKYDHMINRSFFRLLVSPFFKFMFLVVSLTQAHLGQFCARVV